MCCYASVDGTICAIFEPNSFIRDWYIHKLNRAGLRYEIDLSVRPVSIVWASGPQLSGTYKDVKKFRQRLKSQL